MERHFAALAADVGGAVRKMALLRDKGDKLVKAIQDFACSESGTLKTGLEGLAECLTAIENCQQLKVKYAEHYTKYISIPELTICRLIAWRRK